MQTLAEIRQELENDRNRQLEAFLAKMWPGLPERIAEAKAFRQANPDWARPVVMYGVRKINNYIRKPEIGVIIDVMPWLDRARMAETHWYKILHRRPATDAEWEGVKNDHKRYRIWQYFITRKDPIDRIISIIVEDDQKFFGLEYPAQLVAAFEEHFGRPIRIYPVKSPKQLGMFPGQEDFGPIRIPEEKPRRRPIMFERHNNFIQFDLFDLNQEPHAGN